MLFAFCRKAIYSYMCMYNGQYGAQNVLWIMVVRTRTINPMNLIYVQGSVLLYIFCVTRKFSENHKSAHSQSQIEPCHKSPHLMIKNLRRMTNLCKSQICASQLPVWSAKSLQWRRNGRDGVSNHQPPNCLPSRLFKAQIKENIKAPRYWPVCVLWQRPTI